MAANKQMLYAYWQVGAHISFNSRSQNWGSKVIENLSKDIRAEFPAIKGYSPRNLLYMRQFAEAYPPKLILQLNHIWKGLNTFTQPVVAQLQALGNELDEITQPTVAQFDEDAFLQSIIAHISWSHHVVLLNKCPELPTRFWYMLNTLEHGLSKNILGMQIESGLYERRIQSKKLSNYQSTLPKPQSDFANYLLKDPYIFDFVQAKAHADERNIEEQLTQQISKFLLELGQGFAFVGKQYPINVGNNNYYIDLLFYHTRLHCYVVVELKARAFKPGDAAQLNFYINVLNDTLKTEQDQPTIGILLCKGKDQVVAEYALKGINQPIGVADYELMKSLPDNLKSQLPQVDELEEELKNSLNHDSKD
jgi:predicted nuclease of restriction endonuclease-like (RecB) superfamily